MTRLLLLAGLLVAAGTARAQDWQVVWADEFDTDGAPDPAKWDYDIGGNGWGNQESQHYTDRPENARVEDGRLVIEAREESYQGNAYTSARLVTRGQASWTYGRIEARIKLPAGQGIWPAFWMLASDSPYGGWPFSGEIDIMEYLGHDTDRVYGTIHYGGGTYTPCRANRGGVQGHCYSGDHDDLASGTFDQDFHTFAVEWEPREIRWLVDGEVYQRQSYWYSGSAGYPAPFDQPFHLLLNVAVGGQWPGYPDETTVFPQTMEVDYVRVYQDADAAPDVTLGDLADPTPEAGSTVALSATASDRDGVESVEFLQGDGVLGTVTDEPYTLDVDHVADGCYTVRARATDGAGFTSLSAPASVTVGAGCPEGSAWPFLMRPATIPGVVEAEHYDLGGDGAAYSDFTDANTGGGIRLDDGVDVRSSRDSGGGFDVTDLSAREWTRYTVDVAQTGRYRVVARAAGGVGGRLRLSVDGADLLGDVPVPPTGGDVTFRSVTLGEVDLEAGRRVLRLDFRSGGFSLNRLTFVALGATSSDAAPEAGDLGLRVAPNPAADRAVVSFRLSRPGPATVRLFDALGRLVRVAEAGGAAGAERSVTLPLRDLAPGVYTCVLDTDEGTASRPLSVAR